MSNLIKIRRVGEELFHADTQTDEEKIIAFRNFRNAPKSETKYKQTNKIAKEEKITTWEVQAKRNNSNAFASETSTTLLKRFVSLHCI